MTTNDIKNVQILMTTNDGRYFIAVTDNVAIKCLCAEVLQFREVKKELINEIKITDILNDEDIAG